MLIDRQVKVASFATHNRDPLNLIRQINVSDGPIVIATAYQDVEAYSDLDLLPCEDRFPSRYCFGNTGASR